MKDWTDAMYRRILKIWILENKTCKRLRDDPLMTRLTLALSYLARRRHRKTYKDRRP